METAIQNNIDVQTAANRTERSKIDKQQARMNQLPDLNGSVSPGISLGRSIDPFTNSYTDQKINSTSFGLSSGVILFNGLTLQSSVKQTAASLKAAEAGLQQQTDNIKISVILAYLQVLNNQEQLQQAGKQWDVSNEQVKRMKTLDDEGAVKPSELSDLRGQAANDQLSIISTKNSLTGTLVELCRLMNINYNTDMRVAPIDTDSLMIEYAVDKQNLYKNAESNLGQIKALNYLADAAKWNVKAQKGKLYPTLRFDTYINTYYSSAATSNVLASSGVSASDDYVVVNGQNIPVYKPYSNYSSKHIDNFEQFKNNRYSNFSLSLQIPIFNNFRARNNVKLAQINYKEAQQQANSGKTQLQLDVEQAYQNLQAASERYKTLLQQVKDYQQSFNAATVRFNEGVGNVVDYLIAKNNLDRANSNLIATRYDYVLRTKVLDFYQGKPLW
ncbi:MAG: TolC family protein [Ferruginibacter sp.]